jgi:lipopolysaccharide export system protein LptC
MPAELHLPDLPEVPISVGRAGDRAGGRDPRSRSRGARWRERLSAWLPIALMVLLALGSWWLVKNAPAPLKAPGEAPLRSDPDYTLSGFVLERFAADGRLKARLAGRAMRHFPATDRIEVDELTLLAWAPDGRVTQARAQRAVSNGDASEVQLHGEARVQTVDLQGVTAVMSSDFLHLFTVQERVVTDRPVVLTRGGTEVRAARLRYDHGTGLAQLGGPLRAVLPPRSAAP